MTKQVEFFFDVGSPASYLASTQLPGIVASAGAQLIFKPMLLGGIFQATGNASPAEIPAKGAYSKTDMARFAKRYGVSLVHNPHFPINTLTLMRMVAGVQLKMPDRFGSFLAAIMSAMWVDSKNMNDPQVVGATLTSAGFEPAKMLELAGDPDVKAALRSNTDEALARGAFGAPTMFVGDEMFFGQDRMEWVKETLA